MSFPVPIRAEPYRDQVFDALRDSLDADPSCVGLVVQEEGFAGHGAVRVWRRGSDASRYGLAWHLVPTLAPMVGWAATRVKQAVYEAEGRPWYASTWRLDLKADEQAWEWDFEARPRGAEPMNTLETYLLDLKFYPRPDELVPAWMRATLAAAGAWDPEAGRLTLDIDGRPSGPPVAMGEEAYWFWAPLSERNDGPLRRRGTPPPFAPVDTLDFRLAPQEQPQPPPPPRPPRRPLRRRLSDLRFEARERARTAYIDSLTGLRNLGYDLEDAREALRGRLAERRRRRRGT